MPLSRLPRKNPERLSLLRYKPSTSLLVIVFVLLTTLAQVVTLIRSGGQINVCMISIWNIWNCAYDKTLYVWGKIYRLPFSVRCRGKCFEPSITTRSLPAKIMRKRSRTDNAIRLPVGEQWFSSVLRKQTQSHWYSTDSGNHSVCVSV